MAGITKMSEAWGKIFSSLPLRSEIDHEGHASITAEEIKKYGDKREPRLMTYLNTRESRPSILKDITILPINNGTYGLFQFDGYHDLENPGSAKTFTTKKLNRIQTLDTTKITTESEAIDVALHSGLFDEFFEERKLLLTLRGKKGSDPFKFGLTLERKERLQVEVDGAGTEMDAGLEGKNIYLLEAKIGSRTNFLVRQLYYPMRALSSRFRKKVIPVFLTWHNQTFTIWKYQFEDEKDYSSMRLDTAAQYVINTSSQEDFSINTLLRKPIVRKKQETPFPQADDFEKVIDLIEAIGAGKKDKTTIAHEYEFDERQSDYYGNAAVYLGFLEKITNGFTLTRLGERFINSTRADRIRLLLEALLQDRIIREAFIMRERFGAINMERLQVLIKQQTRLGDSTASRRSHTIDNWVSWISEHKKN